MPPPPPSAGDVVAISAPGLFVGDPAPILGRETNASSPIASGTTLAQPGFFEHLLVVVTIFVFYHQTPNGWWLVGADLPRDYSNPVASTLQFALILVALARVAGSIDHLIDLIRGEATVFLFALLVFSSAFWSADPAETFRRAVMFVAVTFFAGYLVLRFSLQRIMTMLGFMFVASAAVNLLFVLAIPTYGVDARGLFDGVFTHKNSLGYMAALAIPTLLLASISDRRHRPLFLATVPVEVFLLIGSESKTMLLAGLAPIPLMAVYHLFRGRKTLRGAVLISLGGTSMFAIAFATANIELLAGWLDKDVTLTGRVPMWEALLPIGLDRFVLGYGYSAAFGGYFSPVHEVWIQNRWEPADAHNAVMQIWLEVGVVGVIVFGWGFVRAVSRAIRIVAVVPGGVGLWPLVFLSTTLLVSVTESGVQSDELGWTLYVVALLSVGHHLRYRSSLGLSNELGATPGGADDAEADDFDPLLVDGGR